jgi:hypothetical protein
MSVDGSVRNKAHHDDKLNGELDWSGKPKPPIKPKIVKRFCPKT